MSFKGRILVTGANGLIGEQLTLLLKDKYELTLIDNREKNKEGLSDSDTNVNFVLKDIQDLTKEDMADVSGIIHLAAVSRVIWGHERPLDTWNVNVGGTQHILNLCQSLNHKPWIIYGSSREVYGEAESFPVDEGQPWKPMNVYGVSKLAAEALVHTYMHENEVPCISLRFSNVYGSLNDHKDRVIPQFIANALSGKDLELHQGSNTFDFTHLDDTAQGIVNTVEYIRDTDWEIVERQDRFNICTGKRTSLKQLSDIILKETGSTSSIIETSPRNYDVNHFYGSWDLAKSVLNYKPKVSLADGLKRLIESMKREE